MSEIKKLPNTATPESTATALEIFLVREAIATSTSTLDSSGPALIRLLTDADQLASAAGISLSGVDLHSDDRFHGVRVLLDDFVDEVIDMLGETPFSDPVNVITRAISNAIDDFGLRSRGVGTSDSVFCYVYDCVEARLREPGALIAIVSLTDDEKRAWESLRRTVTRRLPLPDDENDDEVIETLIVDITLNPLDAFSVSGVITDVRTIGGTSLWHSGATLCDNLAAVDHHLIAIGYDPEGVQESLLGMPSRAFAEYRHGEGVRSPESCC